MAAIPKVIIVTGHPATGKTTLAHKFADELNLPLLWKDQTKESLSNTLGTGSDEWSRKSSGATWALLYQHIETLLKANVSFITEANFDPQYANAEWKRLASRYDFRPIQVLCESDPDVLLQRYIGRIQSGKRHAGHVDVSKDPAFLASIKQPFDWVHLSGPRIKIDTTDFAKVNLREAMKSINSS